MATFTNQATLSYNDVTTVSNTVTGELLDTLSVTKTAVGDTYNTNSDITYIVSIINTSGAALTGLTLSDNLGAYDFGGTTLTPLTYREGSARYLVNGISQAAPTVVAGPPMTINNLNIPANGNATLIYEASPNQYAPLNQGGVINNTASITGAGLTAPATAQAAVTAENDPVLSISKSMNPSVISENGQLTYTFVIENNGNTPADATDNVTVTDAFTPTLSHLAVSFNNTPWTAGPDYTYNPANGLFSTVAGRITVPAATYTQNPATGEWTIEPGVSVLTVTGTV